MTVLEIDKLEVSAIPKWALDRIAELNENDQRTGVLNDNSIHLSDFPRVTDLLDIIENGSYSVMFYRSRELHFFMKTIDENDNFLETFLELSEDQRYTIIDALDEFNSDELASFVFALNISQTDGYEILYTEFDNFRDFRKSFKIWDYAYKDHWGYSFDPLDSYSKNFEDMVNEQLSNEDIDRMGITTLLFLLREMYGENQILEVMNKRSESTQKISMIDVLKLLQDWNEWKDYPIDWAVAAVGDNLQRQLDLSKNTSSSNT